MPTQIKKQKASPFPQEPPKTLLDFIRRVFHPACFGMPLEGIFLDLDKAGQIPFDDKRSLWNMFLQIGFDRKKLLPFIDKAIQPIIERFFDWEDMPFLPFESCSGHPQYLTAMISLIYRENHSSLGKDFLTELEKLFAQKHISILFSGTHIPIFGKFGQKIDPMECLIHHIPVKVGWSADSLEGIATGWMLFSQAMDAFDHNGVYTPKLTHFKNRINIHRSKKADKAYQDLCEFLWSEY